MCWNAGYREGAAKAAGNTGDSTPYAAGALRWSGCDWAWVLRTNGGSEKSLLPAPQVAEPHEAWSMGFCIVNLVCKEF